MNDNGSTTNGNTGNMDTGDTTKDMDLTSPPPSPTKSTPPPTPGSGVKRSLTERKQEDFEGIQGTIITKKI